VGEGEAREDRPDDRGIVQRGDPAEAAPTLGTRQHVDAERLVHEGRPAPGARGQHAAIQELVLYKENCIFSLGQISRESGFPCRHLAAQENQLRCGAHALNV
jgi:hypothetical protein